MAVKFEGRVLVEGNEAQDVYPVLMSNVPLSFWGGIDEKSGVVIDTTHPLHGECVKGTILCLPSGRGSCTASQVLLELILNGKAPKALVLRDADGLVSVGAIIARSNFPESNILDVIQIQNFGKVMDSEYKYGHILKNGSVVFGTNTSEIKDMVASEKSIHTLEEKRLSEEEENMLRDAKTQAEKRAVECIISYARIVSDSPTYVDVDKAHIDGCTFIGYGGLQFVQRLLRDGGTVRIPTTLNSVSTDLRYWEQLKIEPTEAQQASIQLAEAYTSLGCSEKSFTCAPYLLDEPPTLAQQIVWGESNAVVYANSVLGARTEKYADYLDICCAIVGKVPKVGVHCDENRMPKVVIDVTSIDFATDNFDDFSLIFPILGHLCGSLSDGDVPILLGLESYVDSITGDHLKAFCAAFGTTGTSPLIHIAMVTPEAMNPDYMIKGCSRTEKITSENLQKTFDLLDQSANKEDDTRIDWVALGNPHLSLSECEKLKNIIESMPLPRKRHEGVEIIACISRALYDKSQAIPALEKFGIKFVRDTCWCMLLHPPMIPNDPDACILTNSGKYSHYGPGLTNRRFRMGSMDECIRAAVTGKLGRRSHMRLPWTNQRRSFHDATVLFPVLSPKSKKHLMRASRWLKRIVI